MDYEKLATAALERRAALITQIEGIKADSALGQAEKREQIDALETQVTDAESEARQHVADGEREKEIRELAMRTPGLILSGKSDTKVRSDGQWLAAELRAVSGASGIGAAFTPAENAAYAFDRLVAQSAFLASGVQVIYTDKDSLNIPRVLTGPTVGPTAEAAALTTGDATGDLVTATPRKFTHLSVLSSEVVEDSDPALLDQYGRDILRNLALKYDLDAFEGIGTAPSIRGLKNVAGITTTTLATNGQVPTSLDMFADALTTLLSNNANGKKAIVMAPRTWGTLSKLKTVSGGTMPVLMESAGSAGQDLARSIYGIPVFLSSQLSVAETTGTANNTSSAYVYDVEQVYAVVRTKPEVEADKSALFSTDQWQIRGRYRADAVVAQPAAVVRIAGFLP